MCYVTFVSVLPVLVEESRGPEHNRSILSMALHPSSFHCCLSQDPSQVSVLSCLLSLVRVCANCCGVVSALESSLKERALEQGATTTQSFSRCLVLPIVSSLGARSLAHLALSFYIFHTLAGEGGSFHGSATGEWPSNGTPLFGSSLIAAGALLTTRP